MPITVREALQSQGLVRARVVAGHGGLEKTVETITVMESPDIFRWLSGRELVLTSLYAVRDEPEERQEMIPRLWDAGCAGLIVKTGRYFERVPAEMVGRADELGLPIVELPRDVRYVDVITPLMEQILTDRARLLHHSDTIHRSLTQAVLSGGGLVSVTESVGALLRCHAAVVDTSLRWEATSASVDRTALASWLEVQDPMAEQWRGGQGLAAPVVGPDSSLAAIFHLGVAKDALGHLVLWPLSLPLGAEPMLVVEHALTVAVLELMKRRAVREVERRYHDEVLADLLHGRIGSFPDLEQRARHLDWDLRTPYRVMLLDLAPLRAEGRKEGWREAALDAVQRTIRGMLPRPIVGIVHNALVVLLPDGPPTRFRANLEALARAVQFQVAHMTAGERGTLGLSERTAGVLELQRPYEEALDALEIDRLVRGPGGIASFEQLGIYRLLKDCPLALREEFTRSVIGPILEHDRQRGSALMETLDAYLKLNGEAKVAAERLFVHVNTVKYRLTQIEELTGHSPDSSEGRTNFMIALKLLDLMGSDWRRTGWGGY